MGSSVRVCRGVAIRYALGTRGAACRVVMRPPARAGGDTRVTVVGAAGAGARGAEGKTGRSLSREKELRDMLEEAGV